MSAIEASTVRCQTMADGTLRLTLDIEPMHALPAFQLFGVPGRAVGIAALKDFKDRVDAAAKEVIRERSEAQLAQWGALGTLCKTAIAWSNHPEFQEWLGVASAVEAGERIKEICEIESRKDLDSEPVAAMRFRQRIIAPYQKYMVARNG